MVAGFKHGAYPHLDKMGYAELHVHAENLEELARDLMGWVACLALGGRMTAGEYAKLEERMGELGLEVE